jgi:hypothetical protein
VLAHRFIQSGRLGSQGGFLGVELVLAHDDSSGSQTA